MRRFSIILYALCFLGAAFCTTPAGARSLPRDVSLGGEWQFRSGYLASQGAYAEPLDAPGWSAIRVPSNWYVEGYDVSGAHWLRRAFDLPVGFEGERLAVRFEGVDYAADVWLNGVYLGHHVGYFEPFEFDVTGHIADTDNLLVVRVDSPLERPGDDWSLRKSLIKGIFSHHDTRPGGAWSARGQERNTGGIWADVRLLARGAAAVEGLRLTPRVGAVRHDTRSISFTPRGVRAVGQARAEGRLEVALDVQHRGTGERDVFARVALRPAGSVGAQVVAEHRIELATSGTHSSLEMELEAGVVDLWWTWDRGPQSLYELEVVLEVDGVVSDRRVERFGFRSVEFEPESGTLRLNGERVFVRGTNYISTQWLSEMDRERFRQDVTMMREANVNAVRVHAHVEPSEFYRVCDEAGLLVWQDFPLQWGYEDTQEFSDRAAQQARAMVDLLYNHPSIVIWSAHNEPPWDATWMQYKYKTYDPEQNRQLDRRVHEVLQNADDSRYSHMASETSEHPWFGWYSGSWKDYAKPATRGLITEFGAQALPSLESLRRIFPEAALFPTTEAEWELWRFHNFQKKETFEIAGVEQGETVEELIANTQRYQARLTQLAAESYRRQKYAPVGSIYQFMFVEDWPSLNWGVVDYWRQPKPGYEALRLGYQPLLPSIAWAAEEMSTSDSAEALGVELWVVNDLPTAPTGARLEWSLVGPGDEAGDDTLISGSLPVDATPDSSLRVAALAELLPDEVDLRPGQYSLRVRLEADVDFVATNEFRFAVHRAETSRLEEETTLP